MSSDGGWAVQPTATDDARARTSASDDDSRAVEDNSVGRLLTLCDGVFAIAMTLLVLDLTVPTFSGDPSNNQLAHALLAQSDRYWSYLLSFYLVANYWRSHHGMLRSLRQTHPQLIGHNLAFLLFVAVLPFPASLLGEYGSHEPALLAYAAANLATGLLLLLLLYDVRRYDLGMHESWARDRRNLTGTVVVFVLFVPAVLLFGSSALYLFIVLALPRRFTFFRNLVIRARRPESPQP